ncbi:hypothetical protein MG296_14605, partial [Flavobacteriaceae bacterium TK19130]|nr:hypothetical protein [Thermobacterium salinum]
IGVTGIYVSIRVFKMIVRRGYISTTSGSRSSYELDNLKPTPGSGFFETDPEELKTKFKKGEIVFDKVSISIWGDWKGRKLDKDHKIAMMEFDKERGALIIHFSDSCRLEILGPSQIYYSSSYLKIIEAREVHWLVSDN